MEVDPPADKSYEPSGPKPILKLEEDVVNKIAAAEIIHRPANAIKELLENSLDAGSTSIKLSIKEGGLKLIQITDNGHGINRSDLPLLCVRYATSKLREYKDLESMSTYGFRGEALASISFVSHVEVVTKTKVDGCGWKAHYENGVLVEGRQGAGSDPKPAAANDGTIISAEDLFYNFPLRKRALKSVSDEYNRILDVVTKYAIHNPHSAWVCKKAGSNMPDISTPVDSSAKANISLLYTPSLANELLEVPITVLKPDMLRAKIRGWVSNANSSWARKGGWLLFINNRLVESSKIRKAIESMYTAYLPKGSTPWIYLSLEIDPSKVDVNVHPTKSEVHFLNEDEIIQAIVSAVHGVLKGANTSRSFTVQTLLPGAPTPSGTSKPKPKRSGTDISQQEQEENQEEEEAERRGRAERKKAAPNYKVRTDLMARTLDEMLAPSHPSQIGGWVESNSGNGGENGRGKRRALGERKEDALELDDTDLEEEDDGEDGYGRIHEDKSIKRVGTGMEIVESLCEFSSIAELRRNVKKRNNTEMSEIMVKHAFVGVVDRNLCLSLMQHNTKLFLVNHASLADEHFYQLGLRQFGTMDRFRLDPAPNLKVLLKLAAEEEDLGVYGLEIDDVVNRIYDLLMDKRAMIDEYFSLRITSDGEVDSLPMVLRGYTPNLDRLPHFSLCLGTQVNWEDEKACFEGFLKELAFFYSPRPFLVPSSNKEMGEKKKKKTGVNRTGNEIDDGFEGDQVEIGEEDDDEGEVGEEGESKEEIDHAISQIQYVLFPSFRKYTCWPSMGKEINQVANLPDLFRIFERC